MNLKEGSQLPSPRSAAVKLVCQLSSQLRSPPEEEVQALDLLRQIQTLAAEQCVELQVAAALLLANALLVARDRRHRTMSIGKLCELAKVE